MTNPLTYRSADIYEDIRTKICDSTYAYGSSLPPERVLSVQYGVQRPTLRRALRRLAEEAYIETKQGAGSRVIFLQQPGSEQPADKGFIVYAIPLALGRSPHPYQMEICSHLEEVSKADGLSLVFAKVAPNESLPAFLRNSNMAKGIVWVTALDDKALDTARALGIPSITVSSAYPHFPAIRFPDFDCGYMATQHLLQAGSRRIVHIAGPGDYVSSANRMDGYRLALLESGIELDDKLILQGDWVFDTARRQMGELLQSGCRFDGVVAANDMMALGAMRALLSAGLRIPDDVRVIGIDNIEQTRLSTPSLSSVAIDQQDVARTAYMLLKGLMEKQAIPQEICICAKLHKRDST